jgi:hypothetical protein
MATRSGSRSDLSQVTVRPQGNEERNSPLTALIDPGKLDKMYDVSQDATASNGLEWLTLTPKVGAQATFEVARPGFPGQCIDPHGSHRCRRAEDRNRASPA